MHEVTKHGIHWPTRLQELLKRLGKTRKEIAALCGVSVRTLEGWAGGRHAPDIRARRVLRVLWRDIRTMELAQEAAQAKTVEHHEMAEVVEAVRLKPEDDRAIEDVLNQWTRGGEDE